MLPLASGVTADVTLPIATHTIELVVSDGIASASQAVRVVVISASDAVNLLAAQIEPLDPVAAACFNDLAQQIIDAVEGN